VDQADEKEDTVQEVGQATHSGMRQKDRAEDGDRERALGIRTDRRRTEEDRLPHRKDVGPENPQGRGHSSAPRKGEEEAATQVDHVRARPHGNFARLRFFLSLSKPVWTLCGKKQAYVLVFIHLGSRKTFASPPTFHPDGDWVMLQVRNATAWLDDIGVKPRFLIHDRDGKYPGRFKDFWKTEGVRCLRIPPRAPMANAFCECFIGKLKRECLDHFTCFSLGHLHQIVKVWFRHYNFLRPHQGFGINNEVLDQNFEPQTVGEVRCEEELGGIIKSYYREAA